MNSLAIPKLATLGQKEIEGHPYKLQQLLVKPDLGPVLPPHFLTAIVSLKVYSSQLLQVPNPIENEHA